jgi:hypothetical protein
MGRHVHIDYCRGDPCDNPETQHINERMVPSPDQPKDWITHGLHWRRMGEFVDECSILSCLCNDQALEVMGTTQYCLHLTNISLQTRILVKSKRILRSGT